MVYGPPVNPPPSLSELNESNSQLWKIISAGRDAEVPDPAFPLFVDVRDAALAHILALESPKAENQRYCCVSSQYTNQEVDILKNIVILRLSTLSVPNTLKGTSFPLDALDSTDAAMYVKLPRSGNNSA